MTSTDTSGTVAEAGSSEGAPEDLYTVEKVLEKSRIDGKIYYMIKWQDWDPKFNSWEPEEHMDCPDKIKEFEDSKKQKVQRKRGSKRVTKTRSRRGATGTEQVTWTGPNPFDLGYKATGIEGASDIDGQLFFMVKFEGVDEARPMPATIMNDKEPKMVIAFYEQNLQFVEKKK